LPGSPITCGRTKIAGIKIQDTAHDTLDGGAAARRSQLHGWRTAQIHEAILTAFGLSAEVYSLTQLRYDLRKMKAHGLPERLGRQYCYRLTEKGTRVAAMFVLFHKRACGPLANTLLHHRPRGKLQTAQQGRNRLLQSRRRYSEAR
jgi:hypothetical protein